MGTRWCQCHPALPNPCPTNPLPRQDRAVSHGEVFLPALGELRARSAPQLIKHGTFLAGKKIFLKKIKNNNSALVPKLGWLHFLLLPFSC